METVEIFRCDGRNPRLMALAWRLRYRVFLEGLGWEIPSSDGLEWDGLDEAAEHLAVLRDGRMLAYLRLLPASGPTLIGLNFPQFPAPEPSAAVWEASRFAADPSASGRLGAARTLVGAALAYAARARVDRIVALTDPGFARFLRLCGVPLIDRHPPVAVGQGHRGPVLAQVVETRIAAQSALQSAAARANRLAA